MARLEHKLNPQSPEPFNRRLERSVPPYRFVPSQNESGMIVCHCLNLAVAEAGA
jgi:hypothetical protein